MQPVRLFWFVVGLILVGAILFSVKPMKLFKKVISIYAGAGYHLRIGLNPCVHGFDSAQFGVLFDKQGAINTGGGSIAIDEVCFIETLTEYLEPKSILVIGNSFGLSSVALALAWPKARVVAIDCGTPTTTMLHRIMDPDLTSRQIPRDFGIELTRELAASSGLDLKVVQGFSPQDLNLALEVQASPFDLVFIDGDHRNPQVIADFSGAREISSEKCVYIFHDVINWELEPGLAKCAEMSGLCQTLLDRTSSGIGVLFPHTMVSLGEHLSVYTEPESTKSSLQGRWLNNWVYRLVKMSNSSDFLTKLRTWLRSV